MSAQSGYNPELLSKWIYIEKILRTLWSFEDNPKPEDITEYTDECNMFFDLYSEYGR